MFTLRLTCSLARLDVLSAELWERGTTGIQEVDDDDDMTLLAAFESNDECGPMLEQFAAYSPEWRQEDSTDWVQETKAAWPGRIVGERIFLAPPWSTEPAPEGRVRIVHNPGMASGTGEHPCTQLALAALERQVFTACTVVDIGTGSGVLAIAALRLGAVRAVGVDMDLTALATARENFELNQLTPALVGGSGDCIRERLSDITVANISGTVLLSILDDLQRITRSGGKLILTGIPEPELKPFVRLFPTCEVTELNEWRCLEAAVWHDYGGR